MKKTFSLFVRAMSIFEYGSFNEFEVFLNQSAFLELNHINMRNIYLFMMYQCEELFTGRCWWRNKYLKCCSMFVKQRSEYGICYSFNSVVNDVGDLRFQREKSYPWRTSNYGEWSGLRIEINAASSNSVLFDRNGVIV